MAKIKFRVGDRVRFISGAVGRPSAEEGYTIVRVLPVERDEPQYRIKSISEIHERVAGESQLDRRS